jgi:hypothetical protein
MDIYKRTYNNKTTKLYIAKGEYRKFIRYGKPTQHIREILYFYYSHSIQKEKLNKNKSLDMFGYYGKSLIVAESKQNTRTEQQEQTFFNKLLDYLNKQHLNITFQYIPNKQKPFIKLSCKYGLYWITIKKTAFHKALLNSENIDKQISSEIEHLLNTQILKTEQHNKLKFI